MNAASPPPRFIRSRIANACDGCKARKVKCDGRVPCTYCARRQRGHDCHYSAQRRRRTTESHRRLPQSPAPSGRPPRTRSARNGPSEDPMAAPVTTPTASGASDTQTYAGPPRSQARHHTPDVSAAEDETEVPREARLLCDAQGKLIFIGDCAPLSLFQSVRQLVTSRVAQDAFAPQTSRYSALENAPARHRAHDPGSGGAPNVRTEDVAPAVSSYLSTTTGLVDLFDETRLLGDLLLWANSDPKPNNISSIVNYLVLAIGRLMDDQDASQDYFEYARDQAYASLTDNLSIGTVQAFTLVTVYMLCSCQINGAFLFFGIGVRAAYSIGIHRTEVNARFGTEGHRQRDRLWKSLRIVDLCLSTSMGRPTATSDADCTVPYRSVDDDGNEMLDVLNASVQILLIVEEIVMQIYSRKKISLQLTEGISLRLRDWSMRWLQQLKDVIARPSGQHDAQVIAACQVLSSYYYAVMLVSRPFLMYELCRRLSDGSSPHKSTLASGKSKLADACIDAASLMVDPVLVLIERDALNCRAPILVSWLFASSLVLGVGLLGGFGRILEKYTRMSIQALDHFSQNDTHATQYSLIAQSLLTTALEHLERQELQERRRRTESSSQLFGLVPHAAHGTPESPSRRTDLHPQASTPMASSFRARESLDRSVPQHQEFPGMAAARFGEIDSDFLGLTGSVMQTPDITYWNGNMGNDGDAASALNLFPLLDAGGGIDLAHYF